MNKYSKVLLILAVLLSGCTSINYQQRDEYTPDGYSESRLENGNYIVVYETFKKAGSQASLEKLALKRVAELSLGENKSYFEVLSRSYEEYDDKVDIPEHIIKNSYKVVIGSGMGSGGIEQEFDTLIPAHTKTFNIKKISLTILLLAEKNQNSLFASDYLE